ncbi:MAG: HNH endonuclease [Synergistaceae bacterium]|nr:HNH endonuclease [Synergistaceae bacterium]MBQ3759133.1 HNH endonuclease [Synergistaceae bacterium]
MLVYILNKEGKPLMPCKSVKARIMLKSKKAKVIHREPFTIQLLYGSSGYKQPVTLGIDAGARYIGVSASSKQKELYSADVELRTDIVDLLSRRRELRRGRRSRKTRYRQARFDNRKRPEGWLAPSIVNRINAHISVVEKICRILPVSVIIVETASFDIQKIKTPEIQGVEYQQGEQLGFWNVREYVLFRDGHTCQHCKGKSGDKVLNVHHIESRKTGGDAPNNLITLCETCHKSYHAGKIKLTQKRGQSFKEATFMGIMRWVLLDKLREIYPDVRNTYGYVTKDKRIRLGLPKEHYVDAYCIAGNFEAERLPYYWYQKQVRKHNRQIHKTNFIKGGIRKRNQAPYTVFGFRLFDKVICKGETGFIFGRRSSGSFYVKGLDRKKISGGISYKKLKLISKRQTFLCRKERSCAS